ncbi:MAG: type III secretion system chaperone [Pseudomonadota bacterium]
MSVIEDTTRLLASIGDQLNLARVVADEYSASWLINVDDRRTIVIDLNGAHDSLMITSAVAVPHPDRKLTYMEMMLQYNHQWQETDGVRFSIEPTTGEATLIYEMPLLNVDEEQLVIVLENFIEHCETWRVLLQSAGKNGAHPDGDDAMMMRV